LLHSTILQLSTGKYCIEGRQITVILCTSTLF